MRFPFLSAIAQFFQFLSWYKARAENELDPLRLLRISLDGAGENKPDDIVNCAKANEIAL